MRHCKGNTFAGDQVISRAYDNMIIVKNEYNIKNHVYGIGKSNG